MTKRSALPVVLLPLLLIALVVSPAAAQSGSSSRDKIEQPEKVMEATGVKPGMVIGEIGAGQGYFTFWLAKGVGEKGKVYANDIDSSALAAIERRRENEKVANVETILGTVDEPLLPAGALDMVFIVNAFHDLARPVELLANLLPALKPGATVVIMDRDPARFSDSHGHFLTREQVEEIVGRSVFEMDRVETFLRDHNLYILKARKQP
jgi:ubiquinone/menaquinone biosynthesis C-methylase UbiE